MYNEFDDGYDNWSQGYRSEKVLGIPHRSILRSFEWCEEEGKFIRALSQERPPPKASGVRRSSLAEMARRGIPDDQKPWKPSN
jgi:hypothetical protein